jgi:hypothetical protein
MWPDEQRSLHATAGHHLSIAGAATTALINWVTTWAQLHGEVAKHDYWQITAAGLHDKWSLTSCHPVSVCLSASLSKEQPHVSN